MNKPGSIHRRQLPLYGSEGGSSKTLPVELSERNLQSPEQNTLESPPEIQKIIRERSPRYESKLPKYKQHRKDFKQEQDKSNLSIGATEVSDLQQKRSRKKMELRERVEVLNSRVFGNGEPSGGSYKQNKCRELYSTPSFSSQNIVRSQHPKTSVSPGKLSYDTYKVLIEQMKSRHQEQVANLKRHHQLKIKSLESTIRTKDQIIRQLQMESTLNREHISRLEESLSNTHKINIKKPGAFS